MTSNRSREELALGVVVAEARRQDPPELSPDFEERLVRALAEQPRAPAAAPRSWRLAVVSVAAASLCAALGYAFWPNASGTPVSVSVSPAPRAFLDGDALAAPMISADQEPVEVRHEGRARWRLEPGSRAVVQETRERIRITLSRGALQAEVVPGKEPERFVVEAGQARVAVHGTVFRVSLEDGDSVVSVSEGTVAVRALHHPASESVLLQAPARGRFDNDWARPAKRTTKTTTSRRASPAGSGAPASNPGFALNPPKPAVDSASPEIPSALPPEVPYELSTAEIDAGVAGVLQAITRCFTENTVFEHGVRVQVRSSLRLAVAPDGSVTNVLFSPPLSPPVQSCSEREVLAFHFAPSQQGATLARIIDLSR